VEDFAPILHKLLKSLVRQRVVKQRVQRLERHGSDIGTGLSRLNHVIGSAQACRQNVGFVAVVAIDLNDVVDEVHAIEANVIQAPYERADDVGPGFRREQGLGRSEAERHVQPDPFLAAAL
jgi:hypothetical protein